MTCVSEILSLLLVFLFDFQELHTWEEFARDWRKIEKLKMNKVSIFQNTHRRVTPFTQAANKNVQICSPRSIQVTQHSGLLLKISFASFQRHSSLTSFQLLLWGKLEDFPLKEFQVTWHAFFLSRRRLEISPPPETKKKNYARYQVIQFKVMRTKTTTTTTPLIRNKNFPRSFTVKIIEENTCFKFGKQQKRTSKCN